MSLNIKNPKVVAAVRRLARERGVDLTDAVRIAVEHELARGSSHAGRLAAMRSLSDRIIALPLRDRRSADEILGYDDIGLPT